MLKTIRKPFKPVYRSIALAALWANRRDVARWARFVKRAAVPATRPKPEDLKLEAKVRAAITGDPLLRADPSIRDVRVHDGVVVLETPAEWHNKPLAFTRLMQVNGVESVHTAADAAEQHWLDVDIIQVDPERAAML
jgi:hypothetical protein